MLPFHHDGMRELLPIGGRLPRFGKHVTVRFGDAVASESGLVGQTVGEITDWAADQLLALQAEAVRETP